MIASEERTKRLEELKKEYQQKTDKQRIMEILNTMSPIRNKKVRKEFADIYSKIFQICEG